MSILNGIRASGTGKLVTEDEVWEDLCGLAISYEGRLTEIALEKLTPFLNEAFGDIEGATKLLLRRLRELSEIEDGFGSWGWLVLRTKVLDQLKRTPKRGDWIAAASEQMEEIMACLQALERAASELMEPAARRGRKANTGALPYRWVHYLAVKYRDFTGSVPRVGNQSAFRNLVSAFQVAVGEPREVETIAEVIANVRKRSLKEFGSKSPFNDEGGR